MLDLDEAGAKATAASIVAAGGKAIGIAADVTDEDAVRAAVDQVARELGAPIVVVNNAGVTRDNLLFKMSTTDWDTVMNVHLRGAFLVTKAAQGPHGRGQVGPRRQHLLDVGARQPGPGELLGGQGRPAGLHQDPGDRASASSA